MNVPDVAEWKTSLLEDGFAIFEHAVPRPLIDSLIADLGARRTAATTTRNGGVYGERNLLDTSELVRNVCGCPEIRAMVDDAIGPHCFAVRALYLDKPAQANWNLAWHQDVTIAVQERREVGGFGPWSVKAGVTHAHAPVTVLDSLLVVRIHLDDCPEQNGALRVIAGSHRLGKIPTQDVRAIAHAGREVVCSARAGSVLIMRPLLLHASRACAAPVHRRVLHLEFATQDLSGGLEWRWRVTRTDVRRSRPRRPSPAPLGRAGTAQEVSPVRAIENSPGQSERSERRPG